MRNQPSRPALSAQSSFLVSFALLPPPPRKKKKEKKKEHKSLKDCSSKVKENSPSSLCHYVYLAVPASPPLLPKSPFWLLIQLPAGTSNGLCSKSKETFSMGALMML